MGSQGNTRAVAFGNRWPVLKALLLLLLAQVSTCTFSKPIFPAFSFCSDKSENGEAYQRRKAVAAGLPESPAPLVASQENMVQPRGSSWRRIALLILAITIHNVPGETLPLSSQPPACR
jgi:hypothetical protein